MGVRKGEGVMQMSRSITAYPQGAEPSRQLPNTFQASEQTHDSSVNRLSERAEQGRTEQGRTEKGDRSIRTGQPQSHPKEKKKKKKKRTGDTKGGWAMRSHVDVEVVRRDASHLSLHPWLVAGNSVNPAGRSVYAAGATTATSHAHRPAESTLVFFGTSARNPTLALLRSPDVHHHHHRRHLPHAATTSLLTPSSTPDSTQLQCRKERER
ncbi:hypothetical protein VTO42DRAFT_4361 [Malbranchea cinnamomea]